MEQEAAQELFDSQGHKSLLVAVRGISPAECDVAFGECDQPGVRDGDAMGIGAEIAQHMLWSAEGSLGVDDPVMTEQDPQPVRRRRAVELAAEARRETEARHDEMRCEVLRQTCRGRCG